MDAEQLSLLLPFPDLNFEPLSGHMQNPDADLADMPPIQPESNPAPAPVMALGQAFPALQSDALPATRPEPSPSPSAQQDAASAFAPSQAEPASVPPAQSVPASSPMPDAGADPFYTPETEKEIPAFIRALDAEDARRSGSNGFVKFLYCLFAVAVGLPVTAVLVCVGLPFLAAGAWAIYTVIRIVPPFMESFVLVSDTLLLTGAGLAGLAAGLLIAWFGLWLSIALCRLWIGKVLLALGSRMMGY